MKLQNVLWIALLLTVFSQPCWSQPALACGFTGNLAAYPVSAALREDASLPAPQVALVSITRGLPSGGRCDRLGLLTVALQWPRGSGVSMNDIGFEYRLAQGDAPEGLLPATPVAARSSRKSGEHVLTWDDTPVPLHLVLEIRAVTPEGRRGPPALLQVDAPPGS